MKKFMFVVGLSLIAFGICRGDEVSAKSVNLDYGYTYLGCSVQNMPEAVRMVPIHPDDSSFFRNSSVVERKNYEMNHAFTAGILYGKELTFRGHQKPSVNIGIGLDWMIYPFTASGGDMAENTYQGEGREIGSALTYVALRQNGIIPSLENIYTDILLNWTPRVKVEFAPLGDIFNRLWLGASVSYYSLDAQNGWDRYDSIEANEEYTLAHVFPIRVYGILFFEENTDFGLTIGAQFQPSSLVDLGQDAEVDIGTAFYVGFSTRM